MKEKTPLIQIAAQQMLTAGMTLHQAAGLISKAMIMESLRANRGNVCRTARALRIHRNTLSRKMTDLEIADVARECRADFNNQKALRFGGRWKQKQQKAAAGSSEFAEAGDRSRVA